MFVFLRQKACLRGLIFAVSSGLVSYLVTWIMFAGYLILRFEDGRKIRQINPPQTLMNLQYTDIDHVYWHVGMHSLI